MKIKGRRNLIYFIIMLYFILILGLSFYLDLSYIKYLEFINCSFILTVSIVSMFMLGYRRIKYNRLKSSILFITISIILIYFSLYYGMGLFNGFLRNSFSLTLKNMFNNSVFVILTAIFSELFRYIIISSDRESKSNFLMVTIIMILFEYVNCFNIYHYNNLLEWLRFSSLFLLPTIVKNLSLSYLCKHGDMFPSLIYRLIMDSYVYFVPIFPNLSDFINAAFLIVLPFYIYMSNSRIVNEHLYGREYEFGETFKFWDVPLVSAFAVLVILISGVAPVYMVGVASASMEPDIMTGDAVILKKVSDDDKFDIGEIIAFEKDGKLVVHRIVEILEDEGKYFYNTKGDNNNSSDGRFLEANEVDGVYLMKIPYIAKLSIWFNERFGG